MALSAKGVDIRQTGTHIAFRVLLQDSSGAIVTTGTTNLKLYELQSDGTVKSYDWNDNTFKTTALTTENQTLTHRTGNNSTTNTGIWTYVLTTVTGFTVGGVYFAHVSNTGASPTVQAREFQYGSAEGDLVTTANGTGIGELNTDVIKVAGTTQTARDLGASVLLSNGTGTGQISLTSGGVTLADAVAHGGTLGSSTATLALSRLNITSQTSNTNAFTAKGNGTGDGMNVQGGATGQGVEFIGGSSSGNGALFTAVGGGDGIQTSGAATGYGINATGAGAMSGINGTGGSTGDGITAAGGGTSGHGMVMTARGAGKHGLQAVGGNAVTTAAAGMGIKATGGTATTSSGGTAGYGFYVLGGTGAASTNGAGAGMRTEGGGTTTVSGGFGLQAVATGSVADVSAATNGITANITGNLSGSVGSVTGAVGSVTAGVTVTTNNDKTGYSLTQTFPSNFASLGISASGHISNVDTLTTYTGDTPQTGDVFARMTGTGAVTFASLTVTGATTYTGHVTLSAGMNIADVAGSNALTIVGAGSGSAVVLEGGVGGGHGLVSYSLGGGGHGVDFACISGTGSGIRAEALGTGDGIKATASSGVPIRGDITGNLSGSIGSVGTGGITATSIAADAITAGKIADGAIDRVTFAADTGLQTIRSNTAQAGAAGTITLDASASATDDFYNDCVVYITGSTGAGQSRIISDYVGSTQVASVTPNWITNPSSSSTFAILPQTRSDIAMVNGSTTAVTSTVDANLVSVNGSTTGVSGLGNAVKAIVSGTANTGSSTTSIIALTLSPASSVNNQFNGLIMKFTADTTTTALRGQGTDITAFNHSTQTFTVTALTTAPASGDIFVIE